VFILNYKKHKPLYITLLLSVILLLGFRNTGIFVKEYINVNEDGSKTVFLKEENVEVVKEGKDYYYIEKDDLYYEVPKDTLIRTTRSTLRYRVIENTSILDKPDGKEIRLVFAGEQLIPEKLEGEYGIFKTTTDNISGYIYLGDLEEIVQESLSYGISTVNKVIENNNLYYVLAKGEMIAIKNFKEGKFIIVDDEENEFYVNDTDIEVRPSNEPVTRSLISRRTKSLTKLVSSAYNQIGKPYVYGDTGKRGFDCSGLTYSLYMNQLDITLPRSSNVQVNSGVKVDKTNLVPGDLLFFNTSGKRISHVGLYIGEGNMIHASSGKMQVRIDTIDSGYYNNRYVTARRIVN